ncbi:MAG: polysaccharide biosynthesis protein [Acidobacteria bacterium]|nr:polysaccharide biosynthesis protein [Acidobacteriota bacterium]
MRGRHLLFLDLIAAGLAAGAAFVIRFDTPFFWPHLVQAWLFPPLVVLLRLPIYYVFGLYRRMWRYASVDEFMAIAKAVALGSILITAVLVVQGAPVRIGMGFPRSVIVIEGMLSLLLLGGARFALRVAVGHGAGGRGATPRRPTGTQERVLVAGAGDAGATIVREMRATPRLGLLPVGFVDDDLAKLGMQIHNVPVLGTRADIPDLVARHRIEEVIIAMPSAPGRVIREFRTICERAGVRCRTIPGIYELLDGSVSVSQLRDVRLEDLLRRNPITVDLEEVGGFLTGARVLVTGAGGSIGAELCRQTARYRPETLILLDQAESGIFAIHQELATHFPGLDIVPLICDIRHYDKIDRIVGQFRPSAVFHSAARKHVPLMELHPDEAVTTNIIGTRNLIEACEKHAVGRFVLISTDKAVNPSSVMGASKRVAEMLIQEMAQRNGGAFVAVRFGNVLGSSGSVIPIFREQLAAGGPLTVTHPEARRFFMTIPESVQLVIQAAAMGRGGEVFVLEMGQPVKIVDLAMDMISLSGLEPGQDVGIVYTGLRPGEKVCEELFREGEHPQCTKHEHIYMVEPSKLDGLKVRKDVFDLERLAREMDMGGVRRKLQELVPEYQPTDVGAETV